MSDLNVTHADLKAMYDAMKKSAMEKKGLTAGLEDKSKYEALSAQIFMAYAERALQVLDEFTKPGVGEEVITYGITAHTKFMMNPTTGNSRIMCLCCGGSGNIWDCCG